MVVFPEPAGQIAQHVLYLKNVPNTSPQSERATKSNYDIWIFHQKYLNVSIVVSTFHASFNFKNFGPNKVFADTGLCKPGVPNCVCVSVSWR